MDGTLGQIIVSGLTCPCWDDRPAESVTPWTPMRPSVWGMMSARLARPSTLLLWHHRSRGERTA
jgi:hypothetical protein